MGILTTITSIIKNQPTRLTAIPMKPESLYIAGPMSGIPEFNWPAFNAVDDVLLGLGIETVNPARMDEYSVESGDLAHGDIATGKSVGAVSKAGFLKRDFHYMTTCEGIVFLEGWAKSPGANCELLVAQMSGMSTWLWIDGNLYPEPNLNADLTLVFAHLNEVVWGVADVNG